LGRDDAAITVGARMNMRSTTLVQNTRKRLLELAVARVGRALTAARLQVPLVVLDDWLHERTPMADTKLVALVDLLDETND